MVPAGGTDSWWCDADSGDAGETRKRNVSNNKVILELGPESAGYKRSQRRSVFLLRWDAVTLIGLTWSPNTFLLLSVRAREVYIRHFQPGNFDKSEPVVQILQRWSGQVSRLVVVCVTKGRHLLATNWLDICMKCGHPVGEWWQTWEIYNTNRASQHVFIVMNNTTVSLSHCHSVTLSRSDKIAINSR